MYHHPLMFYFNDDAHRTQFWDLTTRFKSKGLKLFAAYYLLTCDETMRVEASSTINAQGEVDWGKLLALPISPSHRLLAYIAYNMQTDSWPVDLSVLSTRLTRYHYYAYGQAVEIRTNTMLMDYLAS